VTPRTTKEPSGEAGQGCGVWLLALLVPLGTLLVLLVLAPPYRPDVEKLLAAGANTARRTNDGKRALENVEEDGPTEIAHLLV
jgi:hypothetical protein